jgi:hypothetical protein
MNVDYSIPSQDGGTPPEAGPQQQGQEPQSPPAVETHVQISRSEYEALLASRADAESRRFAEQGAGQTVEQRLAAFETRARSAEARSALAEVLGGVEFVDPQARAHVAALIGRDIEVRDTAEGYVPFYKPLNRPLGEVPRDLLLGQFKYAVKANGGGGTAMPRHVAPPQPDGGQSTDPNYLLFQAMQARYANETVGTLRDIRPAQR